MRTSNEKVEELHRRMQNLKGKRLRKKMIITSSSVLAACVCIVILSAVFISQIPENSDINIRESMAASIFASDGILGYIVTALIAFTIGIAFSCFCIKLKKWYDHETRDD